ncbi:unnamed protein product [Enterobius vermicularis]|uniref:Peptidase A1 domain-containing protein n=1 Tax=Enterobius vermicularis TaxID=51028 RepID=A0A0N4VQP7_ENTVE|nr:unnamed protein product [Enterobius vermicularis]
MEMHKNSYYFTSEPNCSLANYDYSYCSPEEMFDDIPSNGRRLYTYVEDQVVIRLNQSNERVGFSMSGGADENLQSVINSVLPG